METWRRQLSKSERRVCTKWYIGLETLEPLSFPGNVRSTQPQGIYFYIDVLIHVITKNRALIKTNGNKPALKANLLLCIQSNFDSGHC